MDGTIDYDALRVALVKLGDSYEDAIRRRAKNRQELGLLDAAMKVVETETMAAIVKELLPAEEGKSSKPRFSNQDAQEAELQRRLDTLDTYREVRTKRGALAEVLAMDDADVQAVDLKSRNYRAVLESRPDPAIKLKQAIAEVLQAREGDWSR